MEFPSKWATVIVEYGEKKKHFMQAEESGGQFQFHATEEDAQKWAHEHCAWKQNAMVLVLKVDRMVKAKPVQMEIIAANPMPMPDQS